MMEHPRPLYTTTHSLLTEALSQELIELGSLTADANGYRLTLHALQDDRPVLEPLPSSPHRPIGVTEEVYLLGGGILPYDVVELQALDSSYGGGLRFLGVEVGMMLEPADHILGSLYHLW